ncbi:CAP-Gly domain-containing linker protein 1-like isoform X2 [Dysidea avara]|uniref:CAP-Gly domain-containing linker protein 1-like isoform X2 n=1 Tax=Dysidea avara TaxID=196820 RepID=UPI003318FA70
MDCNGVQSTNDVLRRLHVLFRRCLNFQSISPHLRSRNLLTDHEWQVISEKGNSEDQVDQLLKYLPQKGGSCLHALIKCLQSSLDHAGHQDILVELQKQPELRVKEDFIKAVGTINSMYFDQIITIDQLESRLEEINEQVKRKNQENESLKKELDELKQSQVNHDSHIKKLEDQLSAKDAQIQCLTEQFDLRGSISDSSCEDEYFNTLTETSIPIEESNPVFENLQNGGAQVTSLDASYYSNSPCPSRKRSCSDVTQLIKHPPGAQNSSIENKLKSYQRSMTTYHKKFHKLRSAKAMLVKTKEELENELFHLKDELDAASFARHGSVRQNLSYSSLESTEAEQLLQDPFEESFERKSSTSSRSRIGTFASYFTPKSSAVKKTSKNSSASLEHEATEVFTPNKVPDSSPENASEPLYQGWLLKEGGQKKYWRKRWCVLSSHFFFYFEGKDDPAMKKRPVGILPITPEMEVSEYARDDLFEIADKTRGYMKSCKLDKSKGGYVQGHHAVYKFQANTNCEKERWVASFKKVLENLKQHNV